MSEEGSWRIQRGRSVAVGTVVAEDAAVQSGKGALVVFAEVREGAHAHVVQEFPFG